MKQMTKFFNQQSLSTLGMNLNPAVSFLNGKPSGDGSSSSLKAITGGVGASKNHLNRNFTRLSKNGTALTFSQSQVVNE